MAKGRKAKSNDENGANLGFEAKLWAAADALRNNMDAAEYKHVVLGLIFLKYISDAFEAKHAELEAQKALGADPEDPDEYKAVNIFWVPKEARWQKLKANAPQPTIGKMIDDAMTAIERDNPSLKGVLPKDFARPGLDKQRLGQIINLVSDIALGSDADRSKDTLGRVYEYFLARFASAEGKSGGQFYTPRSVVRVLVEMLAPFKGRVYDPCCGSGGMFVQSEKFIEAHSGKLGDISIYGQESNYTTWRLAKMNLAIRGIDAQIAHGDTFHKDGHPDLKADFVLANPPFNDSDWRGDLLRDDKRWKFGAPPVGNANFAWVQHFISHLAPKGLAGFVLANGSMSSSQSGEGEIRKNIIEADLVDCMVAMPGQLFYSTQIPVCLWFLARNKNNGRFRDRRGETLFIDARKLGTLIDRVHRDLTDDDIAKIAGTYHAWRGDPHPGLLATPLPEGEGLRDKEGGNYRGGLAFSGLIETVRILRQKQTPAEETMWELLRDRRFLNLKFRRQHQFGTFILDFYCDEQKLVIELDGPIHKKPDQKNKDEQRDAYLRDNGFSVLRFPNDLVFSDPYSLLEKIQARCPSPSGRGGGGEGVAVYRDIPGFCKSVKIEEIRKHGYVLTPGRYVGAEAVEDDGESFEEKMKRLTAQLRRQMEEGRKLDIAIEKNLKELGFGK
jgi:type I restriction enzyme M protein